MSLEMDNMVFLSILLFYDFDSKRMTTSAAVQNSNAGGNQLVRHTLKLKSINT